MYFRFFGWRHDGLMAHPVQVVSSNRLIRVSTGLGADSHVYTIAFFVLFTNDTVWIMSVLVSALTQFEFVLLLRRIILSM